jgi:hypothetical protein
MSPSSQTLLSTKVIIQLPTVSPSTLGTVCFSFSQKRSISSSSSKTEQTSVIDDPVLAQRSELRIAGRHFYVGASVAALAGGPLAA